MEKCASWMMTKKPECYCPTECEEEEFDPHCSVFLSDYPSLCEVHRHACSMKINVAINHKGKCKDYAEGQQLSKLADESLLPRDHCLEDEILQFAERFLEWAMINKLVSESDDPESLNLFAKVMQIRDYGLDEQEKRDILRFQFDEIDKNQDGLLQKPEVDGILIHVPHEDCMFGFMISSDANGDHMLSRQEFYASFKYVANKLET